MSQTIPLLARQPIFNRHTELVGYELLYRSSDTGGAHFTDGDSASSQVLLSAFTELSLEQVVGPHKAYINFTGTLMDAELPFDHSQLVVEVLETEAVNAELLHRLRTLRERGVTVALDDFVLTRQSEQLLPYADIVKLDVLALTEAELRIHINQLKPFGLQLLAEKIETVEMLEHCRSLGCDLFQGYFLEKPQIFSGRRINESKQSVLQLLVELNNPEVAFEDIEQIIARDPVMSYKLLRLVNSAAFALPRTIESLHQALTLLGLRIIRNWVGLLSMAKLGDKPAELSTKALTRAKLCELMAAQTLPKYQTDGFFTVGLLSTLDAFLDTPLPKVLEDIQLSEDLKEALLSYRGKEGLFLKTAIDYEYGKWSDIDWPKLADYQLDPQQMATLYLQTLEWVDQTRHTIEQP